MPCITGSHNHCKHEDTELRRSICDLQRSLNYFNEESDYQLNYYKIKAEVATKLLCQLIDDINNCPIMTLLSQELKDWYAANKGTE